MTPLGAKMVVRRAPRADRGLVGRQLLIFTGAESWPLQAALAPGAVVLAG